MTAIAGRIPQPAGAGRLAAAAIVLLTALALGGVASLGLSAVLLLAILAAPFLLLVTFARPHWGVAFYVVLVYTDLLSVLTEYQGVPPLARFSGAVLLAAVLGYRLVVRHQGLAMDEMTWWLVAYGVVVALGLVYARSPELVLPNVVEFGRSFLTFLVIINAITTPGRLHRTLWALLGAGVLLSLLTLYQTFTGHFENTFGGLAQVNFSEIAGGENGARPGGTNGDPNYYGQSLLILVPLGFYLASRGGNFVLRLLGLASSGVLALATIFTYSRGDALALAAVLGAAALYKRPKLPYWVVGAIALALLLPLVPSNYLARLTTILDVVQGNRQTILTEESIRGRAGAAQAAIAMFSDHAILGVGRENYPLYELDYLSGTELANHAKGIPPHDLYLEVAAEQGVVGILIFGGIMLGVGRALSEARRRFRELNDRAQAELAVWLAIGLLGYMVSGLFLHGAFLSILWLQVALIVALRQVARAASPVAVLTSQPGLEIAVPDRGAQMGALAAERALFDVWINAAELAWRRGERRLAKALVDLVLERDPYNSAAWSVEMKLRLQPAAPSGSAQSLAVPVSLSAPVWPSAPTPLIPAAFARTHSGSETHYEVEGAFLSFFQRNGGVRLFGRPISPVITETAADGETLTVQYFERARFEYQPQYWGTRAEVSLGRLGVEVPVTGTMPERLPGGLAGIEIFFRTSGLVTPVPVRFFNFWQQNGGLALFGYPITPVLLETRPRDGDQMLIAAPVAVQYFERARFEFHAAEGPSGEVRLSDLGAEVYVLRYGGRS